MSEQVFHLAFHFLEQEPLAAARLLEGHDHAKVTQFLANTPVSTAVKVLSCMLPEYSAPVFADAEDHTVNLWMSELNSKDLCSILRYVDSPRQQALLAQLGLKKKAACQLLLSYREDMVGAFIETDIIVFAEDMTVDDCTKRLKTRQHREEKIIFVSDNNKCLLGELAVPELLRSTKSINIGSLAKPSPDPISGRSLIRSALRHPVWETHDYAPVVNRQRELLGILWHRHVRQYTSQNTSPSQRSASNWNPGLDLLHAHGDSMRALVEIFYKDGL